MSNIHYFQRYHSKENTHSANACLLLSRLYFYNTRIFYCVISELFEIERNDLETCFVLQEKISSSNSVPDFSINQPGFKLIVEAKEKANRFNSKQLNGHIDLLNKDVNENKFLVLLSPSFGAKDNQIIEQIVQQNPNIKCKPLTYDDLCSTIESNLVDIRDDDMLEILNDYCDYCEDEDLINKDKETIMVRLAGDTIDFDVENNLYFDTADHKSSGFSYIALYKQKSIKYIGKITKIINCSLLNKEITTNVLFGSELLDFEIETIKKGLFYQETRGNNMSKEYTYYLVDEFVPVTKFVKESKYALYGRKKFYLHQFGLKAGAAGKDIAAAMANKKWENIGE